MYVKKSENPGQASLGNLTLDYQNLNQTYTMQPIHNQQITHPKVKNCLGGGNPMNNPNNPLVKKRLEAEAAMRSTMNGQD